MTTNTFSGRRAFLKGSGSLALAALAMPALVGRAQAAQSLTVASLMAPEKPETLIWTRIAEIVEEKMPGAFSFNVVPNAALGAEKEVAQAAKLGSVQASLSTISLMSSWVPETQILDLPFLFRDADHMKAATESEVGDNLKSQLADQGFVVPAFINYGARHLLTKEPISAPGPLRGMNMRTIQSPLHTRLWASYGANPTGIPIVETYNALQTGVVDCMDLTKSAYTGFKLYEVVPCLTETSHIWAGGVIYFSSIFWNGLNDDQKEVLSAAATEGATYFNELMVQDEKSSMEQATAAGGQTIQPTEMDAWVDGAKPVWEDMADIVGGMDRIEMVQSIGA
ncbi:TRAP transporter substrate-binding protein [Celeribacter indicus]|uniref:ABC transporter substrate binding protein n=1 Tax=Celeribacter indicus TaxID=1208324 RepID=A0A0B5E6W3_9RHOB|nr:TRAP transporter substrate-binding protein [Celeribacter indicus]AJE48756.1 ABC transporter substrate binding protein [Celeribacter indicus]SDX11338.1 tripartite ATP-independent transporter solute receptor, DctP family [Celeribacter indicus]